MFIRRWNRVRAVVLVGAPRVQVLILLRLISTSGLVRVVLIKAKKTKKTANICLGSFQIYAIKP